MDVNEALQLADICRTATTHRTPIFKGPITALMVLANEVRRLQAVEAVPVAWARADLLPLAPDRYTPCILTPTKCVSTPVPLYKHPPSLDDDTRNQFEDKLEMVDDGTLKLVLELCHEITMRYSANLHPEIYRRAENLRVKLEAGDE